MHHGAFVAPHDVSRFTLDTFGSIFFFLHTFYFPKKKHAPTTNNSILGGAFSCDSAASPALMVFLLCVFLCVSCFAFSWGFLVCFQAYWVS